MGNRRTLAQSYNQFLNQSAINWVSRFMISSTIFEANKRPKSALELEGLDRDTWKNGVVMPGEEFFSM